MSELKQLADLGGVTVIAALLIKIIWNDLRHINTVLVNLEIHARESKELLKKIAAGIHRHK